MTDDTEKVMNPATHTYSIPADAELVGLLKCLQQVIFEHPVAAQAAFAALVTEGRAFAETAEGAQWRRRLAGSHLVEKGRALWESLTFNVLEDNPDVVVPSRILDAFVKATHEHNLEGIIGRLAQEVAP